MRFPFPHGIGYGYRCSWHIGPPNTILYVFRNTLRAEIGDKLMRVQVAISLAEIYHLEFYSYGNYNQIILHLKSNLKAFD